jgi:CheY-like chemotaxis protein
MPEPTQEQSQALRGLFTQLLAAWPDTVRQALIDYHVAAWQVGLQEGRNRREVMDELRDGGVTPDVPVIVLTGHGAGSRSATVHVRGTPAPAEPGET